MAERGVWGGVEGSSVGEASLEEVREREESEGGSEVLVVGAAEEGYLGPPNMATSSSVLCKVNHQFLALHASHHPHLPLARKSGESPNSPLSKKYTLV